MFVRSQASGWRGPRCGLVERKQSSEHEIALRVRAKDNSCLAESSCRLPLLRARCKVRLLCAMRPCSGSHSVSRRRLVVFESGWAAPRAGSLVKMHRQSGRAVGVKEGRGGQAPPSYVREQ
ncbi:uncharacterized protein B0H18DRAFT_456640 [Fomitopsis serialis]|uniref:uncharacterized protein n=1 Tax=Fomitopsis serialis TaxID=139415 RepID=UPI00200776E9|nr:uncharacterized protein B0H18DRAFT_456640 [Neoantrodia serialis]KAH9923611.1 hypothetical protein B0H18DRAFT_456640 [Neoantrodia serialis]